MPTATITRCGGGSTPTNYPALVASIGSLVAYWRMGAASGNQPDTSANPVGPKDLQLVAGGTAGTYQVTGATPLVNAGQSDGAWRSNYNQAVASAPPPIGDYFTATDAAARWAFSGTSSFSVSLWINPTAGWSLPTTASPVPIVGTQAGGTPNHGWGLSLYPPGSGWAGTGQIVTAFRNDGIGGGDQLLPTSSVASGVWTHIGLTYDGTTMRLYYNGVQVGTLASAKNVSVDTDIRVASGIFWGTTVGVFFGALDEIALYSIALTPAQVLLLAYG